MVVGTGTTTTVTALVHVVHRDLRVHKVHKDAWAVTVHAVQEDLTVQPVPQEPQDAQDQWVQQVQPDPKESADHTATEVHKVKQDVMVATDKTGVTVTSVTLPRNLPNFATCATDKAVAQADHPSADPHRRRGVINKKKRADWLSF